MPVGRFAPSPTGTLHVGNLRTALVAWLAARADGGRFVMRMEDLDLAVSSREHETAQLRDLDALGIDWDGPVVRQSERGDLYAAALADLATRGLTYECFCSRREVRAAAAAPHGTELVYPGTCRNLDSSERSRRAATRPPALRLRADPDVTIEFDDAIAGPTAGSPSDVVLRRNDGVPAYHLAVVVDDADQGIEQVVRGDDLLSATPSQIALQRALGLPPVLYVHVPLVLGPTGDRLAKRDGAVTLDDLAASGQTVDDVRSALAASLGLVPPATPVSRSDLADLAAGFELASLRQLGRAPIEFLYAFAAKFGRERVQELGVSGSAQPGFGVP